MHRQDTVHALLELLCPGSAGPRTRFSYARVAASSIGPRHSAPIVPPPSASRSISVTVRSSSSMSAGSCAGFARKADTRAR